MSHEIVGAVQTRDGRWRVEAVHRAGGHYYRIVHGETVVDGLTLGAVERFLHERGIDIAEPVEAPHIEAFHERC